ncbi:DedA family protein [Agrococcus sp. SGAir0287]|uniref:DedA family protein n=1 Tax=Agrococcus sp. SGAir0287 TaxID=2070347 RepID=UPI0010CCDD07|nr:VTT domain-containing protein [Agrococcus sp. SGAir0287]QCR19576.1 alkaline phosphatase [Agrococcus sp. SGAir0287]
MDSLAGSVLDAAVAMAASPWVLVVVAALCVVDSIVPPLPTEAVVIAVVTLGAVGDAPHPVAVGATIALAATVGDTLAYVLGRTISSRRWLRRRRVRALARQASALLRIRGASIVVAARFVPGLRVAVNATAGAVRMDARRFVPLVAVAATLWAMLTVLVGVGAAWALGDSPALAAAVGAAAGLGIGLAIDAVLRRRGMTRVA